MASVSLTNGGSGYTCSPSVDFSGGGGLGATASAALTPTAVANVTLTSGGSGYTSTPSVAFAGGGGSGASATATLGPVQSQTIGWDVENRAVSVTGGSSFIYAGDGNRVKKTENGETSLYINKYCEKNLTTGEATTYYCHGDKLVAKRTGTTLEYVHQDHLTGSPVVSGASGNRLSAISCQGQPSARRRSRIHDSRFMKRKGQTGNPKTIKHTLSPDLGCRPGQYTRKGSKLKTELRYDGVDNPHTNGGLDEVKSGPG